MNYHTPLTTALSEDNDQTWPHRRDLATSGIDTTFGYPMAIQAKDVTIHVIRTTGVRDAVIPVSFKEEAILEYTK